MKSSYDKMFGQQVFWTAIAALILGTMFHLQNQGLINLETELMIAVAIVATAAMIGLDFIIRKLITAKMKTLASSPTIGGIEKMINEYFYSTSYRVDPETLEVSNSTGKRADLVVKKEGGRYKFMRGV